MRFTTSLCMMFLVCLASCQQRTTPDAEAPAPSVPTAAGKYSSSSAAERTTAEKAEERNQAISKLCRKLINDDKLHLTGTVGSTLSSTAEGDSWSLYQDSQLKPAEADQVVRTVHRELWRFVEQQGWDVQGPRQLPADERIYRFDLRYTVGNTNGVIAVSFLPHQEDTWVGEEKKSARLVIKKSESPKK